jgi:hypothetical protein
MFVEIGAGLRWWVIFHFVANAFLRVFQFLRSMNSIQDFYDNPYFYKNAPFPTNPWPKWLPERWGRTLYYRAMNSFALEWFLLNTLIRPWLNVLTKINMFENWLALGHEVKIHEAHMEEQGENT